MGLLGGYVWRAFENTKRRPLFLPMSQRSFRREPQANPTRQAA